MKARTALVWAGCFGLAHGQDEAGFFTLEAASEGKAPIEARILELAGSKVKIQRKEDSRIFTADLSAFSADTQDLIQEHAPKAYPKLQVDMRVGRRRTQNRASVYKKDQHLSFEMKVTNTDRALAIEKARITLLVFARDMKIYNRYEVLSRQTTDAELLQGKPFEHQFQPLITTYDDDQNEGSSLGGLKYHGYVLIFQDLGDDDSVFFGHSWHGSMQKKMEDHAFLTRLLGYQEKKGLDRNLEPEAGATTAE